MPTEQRPFRVDDCRPTSCYANFNSFEAVDPTPSTKPSNKSYNTRCPHRLKIVF